MTFDRTTWRFSYDFCSLWGVFKYFIITYQQFPAKLKKKKIKQTLVALYINVQCYNTHTHMWSQLYNRKKWLCLLSGERVNTCSHIKKKKNSTSVKHVRCDKEYEAPRVLLVMNTSHSAGSFSMCADCKCTIDIIFTALIQHVLNLQLEFSCKKSFGHLVNDYH